MTIDWNKPIKYVGRVKEFQDQDWTVLCKDNGGPRSVVVGNGKGSVQRVRPSGHTLSSDERIFRNAPPTLWVVRTHAGSVLSYHEDRTTAECVKNQHRGRTLHKMAEVPLDD